MSTLIAADAGGSTCRVALLHEGRRYEARLGAANVSSDFDGAIAALVSGLSEVAKEAGLPPEALRPCPAYLALAGVTGPEIAARVAAALPLDRALVEEDRRAAVAGALGDRTGCVAGIGTGSFVARQRGGAFHTLGGHGLVLGDEASGAWLGRELLVHTLHALDGLAKRSPLTEALLQEMGGSSGIIRFAAIATPQDFGRLAPRLTATPQDPAATKLLQRGANYLARSLTTLGWQENEALCLLGGVAPAYAGWLPAAMQSTLTAPKGTGLDGALMLAERLTKRRSG